MRGRGALVFALLGWLGCQSPAAEDEAVRGHVPPERFGLGAPASAEEIAAWDIDVMPNGEGLPDGGGTAVEGKPIYRARCASCHGAEGHGGPFDQLVGRLNGDSFPFGNDPSAPKTIGNYWPWATTIFDYTRRAMPLDSPGSLSDDEVYAVTAYLLFMNGLFREDRVLDRNSLPGIVMPARGRFYEDDRRGGAEVR